MRKFDSTLETMCQHIELHNIIHFYFYACKITPKYQIRMIKYCVRVAKYCLSLTIKYLFMQSMHGNFITCNDSTNL